jgi:hypothetical protein
MQAALYQPAWASIIHQQQDFRVALAAFIEVML